jgi:hypothetical protein
MKFCPECGTNIEGMKFCPSCGTPVASTDQVGATVNTQSSQEVSHTSFAPLYEFVSHIAGKNARVTIYDDRIEWAKEGSKVARAAAATATLGVSLLAGKKHAAEVLPMKSITHIATKRDGLMNTKVILTTSGGNIEMRVSHDEAAKVKEIILSRIL